MIIRRAARMPKKAQRKPRIKLDINNMMKEKLGSEGLGKSDIVRIMPRLKAAARTLKQKRDDAQLGFMLSPYDLKAREEVKKHADRVRREFDNIIVVGMSGYTAAINAVF